MSHAIAIAHPNIALAKYWGKQRRAGNYPAVPSLSMTLDGLRTRTRVDVDPALADDVLVLNGAPCGPAELDRVRELLGRVREATGDARFARVTSDNDFPTAGGLASSASGFAALAFAAARAYALDWDPARLSDLARRSSASAARSVFGGFVELPAGASQGEETEPLAARPLAPADHLDVTMLVCVTRESPKEVSSREGMNRTAATSPYYAAWLAEAPRIFAAMREALLARDLRAVGELAERSALAMHAAAIAAGVMYLAPATLEALARVNALRDAGMLAFATMDAGPHVKVLSAGADAARARALLEATPGVLRVIEARPGPGARVVEAEP